MADTKISGLTAATTVAGADEFAIVQSGTTKRVSATTTFSSANAVWQGWTMLTSPLTSTSWDGDSFSTTAKTLIDLSAVFSVPAGVLAIVCRAAVRDSASAATADLFLLLSPESAANSYAVAYSPSGQPNDSWLRAGGQICPCDSNGDIYYQIAASGAGTFDVNFQIWGYLVG